MLHLPITLSRYVESQLSSVKTPRCTFPLWPANQRMGSQTKPMAYTGTKRLSKHAAARTRSFRCQPSPSTRRDTSTRALAEVQAAPISALILYWMSHSAITPQWQAVADSTNPLSLLSHQAAGKVHHPREEAQTWNLSFLAATRSCSIDGLNSCSSPPSQTLT